MRIGVQLHPQFGGSVEYQTVTELQFEQARLCEKLGFDSIWVNEHHVAGDLYFPPLTLLSALAVGTKKIRLGSFIIAPFYRPIELAEQVAAIDLISGGRVILAPVPGYREEEFRAYGIPIAERASRTDEVVELTKMLWTQPSVSWRGRFFTLDNVSCDPKPVQQPHPPLWVGAMHNRAVKRAARLGEGWVSHLGLTPLPVVAKQVEIFKSTLRSVGKDQSASTIASMVYLSIDVDDTVAREKAQIHMAQSIESYLRWGVAGSRPELWSDNRFLVGSPDECLKRINGIGKVGVNYLILRVGYKGMSPLEVIESIRTFGEKVLPNLVES